MSDLLTTRELQELLCVDRKTIYRMLKDGRLPAVRVGGQWRFQRETIQAWLSDPNLVEKAATTANDKPPSAEILPLDCFKSVQDVFAEALEIGAVTTNLAGEILIAPSHSCEFCDLILASEEGRRRCMASWARLNQAAPSPHIERCHAGLCYARGRVEVGGDFLGMVFAGQFVTAVQEREQLISRSGTLAREYHIPAPQLRAAAHAIPVIEPTRADKVLHLLGKLAATLSGIGERRLELLTRLRQVARLSAV